MVSPVTVEIKSVRAIQNKSVWGAGSSFNKYVCMVGVTCNFWDSEEKAKNIGGGGGGGEQKYSRLPFLECFNI